MLKIKDQVTLLDEIGIFTIIEKKNNGEFVIEDEHGFDQLRREEELVLYQASAFDHIEIETFENRYVKQNPFAKKRNKQAQIPVIDLHIENLLNAHGHMANHEIVLFQLDNCKKQLDKHIERGTNQLMIVHGVGKGRLREEVRYLLNSYPNIEYMDEHWSDKGIGATKVFVK